MAIVNSNFSRKAVLIFALLAASLHIIQTFATQMPPNIGTIVRTMNYVINFLQVLLYLSFFVAVKKRNPCFYLPYLVIQAIELLFLAIMIVAFTGLLITAPQSWIDKINKEHPEYEMTKEKFRFIIGIADISFAFGITLLGFFYAVVFCFYKEDKQTPQQHTKLLEDQ